MYRELIAEALEGHAWARLQNPLSRTGTQKSGASGWVRVPTRNLRLPGCGENIPDLIRKYYSGRA